MKNKTMVQTKTFSGERAGYIQDGPCKVIDLFRKLKNVEWVQVTSMDEEGSSGVRFYRAQFKLD